MSFLKDNDLLRLGVDKIAEEKKEENKMPES